MATRDKRRAEGFDPEHKSPSDSEHSDGTLYPFEKDIACTQLADEPEDAESLASTRFSRSAEIMSNPKRARRIDLTFDRIQPTFELPIKDAALQLGTSVNTLKRAAREHGIPSWPCREITGLQSTVSQVQLSIASSRNEPEAFRLAALLSNLQNHIECLKRTGKSPPERK